MIQRKLSARAAVLLVLCFSVMASMAQSFPSIDPQGSFMASDAEEASTENPFSGSAPIQAEFTANPSDNDGWDCYYEWRFYKVDNSGSISDEPYLVRHEENTSYTFNEAGVHKVYLYATFTKVNDAGTVDTMSYTDVYYHEEGGVPITVNISESKLDMPNAFSPNGDFINDVYKAKSNYQSIVSFHATIYNRWGQKLYEWSDINEGWDGTFHGKPVKQGVYFVLVEARGADGRKFNIKKDVNLLRGYTEGSSTTGGRE